jgi:SH3 domain-containing protein
VLGAIACGAIYLVLTPVLSGPPPIPNRVSEASRPLAYEEKIARTSRSAPAPGEARTEQHAVAPADATPTESAPAPDAQAGAPAEGAETAPPEDDMAALPPDEGAAANDPDSLPWQQHTARPGPRAAPGMDEDAADPRAQQPGEYDDPSDPMAALPGENDDPNAWPAEPEDEPQEWVQVLVSGAGMHATASEDAPALFAFPYGRTLRVVSRYEGWVEVTDPQSAATGWMQSQYLAPTSPPGMRQEQNAEQTYDEDMPRWKRRWLRRHGGGLGDLIGRAIEGDF